MGIGKFQMGFDHMHREYNFDQVAHEDLPVEYKVDFTVLVNHMEDKTIGGVSRLCKFVDSGYYLPQKDQQDWEYH